MEALMKLFRTFLIVAWVAIAAMTLWAIADMGLLAAAQTFVRDFAHPWRAQYYSDFSVHLILAACWILYRETSPGRGLLFAFATLLMGALFTLPYLLVASLKAGDARRLLLGERAAR
jgi:hypothetical protein